MQIFWIGYRWHEQAWSAKLEHEKGLGLINKVWMWMGPKFDIVKLAREWGLGFSGEAWTWIGLKFDQWNLMGLVFDPWIPSNESWCCNVGTQELRPNGAQFLKVHHSNLKCKRIIQTLPSECFFFVFFCVHCVFNIELMSCPCLCFKNWNLNWSKIWI
jgi:hypothetical protein